MKFVDALNTIYIAVSCRNCKKCGFVLKENLYQKD